MTRVRRPPGMPATHTASISPKARGFVSPLAPPTRVYPSYGPFDASALAGDTLNEDGKSMPRQMRTGFENGASKVNSDML